VRAADISVSSFFQKNELTLITTRNKSTIFCPGYDAKNDILRRGSLASGRGDHNVLTMTELILAHGDIAGRSAGEQTIIGP
jgi:hypothetical protein